MRFMSLYWVLFFSAGCAERGFNSNPADSRDIIKPPAKKDAPDVVLGVAKPSVPASRAQVSIVSVGLKTNKDAAIGKNDRYQICFAKDKTSEPDVCLPLDRNEIGGVRADSFDRYQLTPSASGKSISPENSRYVIFRPDPDSMTAKSRSAPISCLDVRFDGLPKFCKNEIDGTFSKSLKNGTKELRFSMGEREQCVSCEPGGRLTAKPKLGMPGPRAIRVWVRTDATRDVKVVLAESEEGDEVASATARPQPQDDFTATLKVHSEKIMSNKTYYYRVLVDDKPQTRWIPARTAGHLKSKVRIAMGSCAKGPIQPVYDGLIDVHERQGLDAMLYLGDNFYGDRSTLDGHRFEYRTLDAVEQRANFLMQVPSLATWDDHDFVGNNSDGLCTGKEEALKGFKEAWPNPSFGTDGAPGTFTSAKMGPLDVFMLDCRSYRPRNYSDRESRKCDGMIRDVTLPSDWGPIGKEQYRWLMESLQNSKAPFKLIACGSLMTGDSAVQRDSWGNFPEAQRRFFNDLKGKNIRGVVLAAGDIHRSEFRKYERSKTYPVYEFVASPLSLTHANGCGGETDPRRVGECYAKGNSFISVEVNGAANDPTLTAIIHDADGKEKNRLEIKRSEL